MNPRFFLSAFVLLAPSLCWAANVPNAPKEPGVPGAIPLLGRQAVGVSEALEAGRLTPGPDGERAALDKIFESPKAPETGAPADPVFAPKAENRAQQREELFENLKEAAATGDDVRIGGMLYKLFDFGAESAAAEAAVVVLDAQSRRDLRAAMGTAIYLINGSRDGVLTRALTPPAFALLERADKADDRQLASAAMLSDVLASAPLTSAEEKSRALTHWKAAVGILKTGTGSGYAQAAASNAVLGRSDNAALKAAGLEAWESSVKILARTERDTARQEILRVATGYENFGEDAKPFRALAVALLRKIFDEDVPLPRTLTPEEKIAHLTRAFAEYSRESLAHTIAQASVETPAEYHVVLRAFIEKALPGVSKLQRHLTALDENGDGLVSLPESYRSLRSMGFGRLQSALIAAGSQVALVVSTGRVGWFSFRVDGGPKGLHRTVDSGAMVPGQELEAKLDEFMAEDLGGKGYIDSKDLRRYIDKRAALSKANRVGTALVKAANFAEFAALFSLRNDKMSREDLRDFYTGSLFFALLSPDVLASRLVGLRR